MSHITFAEIYGHEKGLKEGRTEGIKEGRTEGIKEGLKDSLREALVVKFPTEGLILFEELKDEQNVDRLRFLLRAALLAQSVEDFRLRIAPPA